MDHPWTACLTFSYYQNIKSTYFYLSFYSFSFSCCNLSSFFCDVFDIDDKDVLFICACWSTVWIDIALLDSFLIFIAHMYFFSIGFLIPFDELRIFLYFFAFIFSFLKFYHFSNVSYLSYSLIFLNCLDFELKKDQFFIFRLIFFIQNVSILSLAFLDPLFVLMNFWSQMNESFFG
jgi:hypothetical protein